MKVELLYLDGCPHWAAAEERLVEALRRVGCQDAVLRVKIDSLDEDFPVRFRGSPTILLDGRDPFPGASPPAGVACRLYLTEKGSAGAPTVEQLVEILQE